jgi:hypothetical protein
MSRAPLKATQTVDAHYRKALPKKGAPIYGKKLRYQLKPLSQACMSDLEEEYCKTFSDLLAVVNTYVATESDDAAGEKHGKPSERHADPAAVGNGGGKLPPIARQGYSSQPDAKDFAALFLKEELLKAEVEKLASMKSVAHIPIKSLLSEAIELEKLNEELNVALKVAQELYMKDGGEAAQL